MLKQARWSIGVMGVLAALALAAADAAGAEKVLRWKFTPGETLHFRMVQDINQTIRTGEGAAPMAMTNHMTLDMNWHVKSVDDQGAINLEQTIERMAMKVQSAQGVLLEYDSAAGKEPEGMAKMLVPMFEAMVKKPFQVKFTPRGEMKEIKLPQGMVENLNKVGGGQLGGMFSEDQMKQMGEIAVFPEGPVTPGQTWTRKTTIKNQVVGNQQIETTFRYEGTETRDGKTLDKISMSLRFKPAEEKAGAEQKQGMLTIGDQEGKGTIFFDSEAGHVVENSGKTKMKMDMNILGQKIAQDLDMTMEMKLQPAETK